MHGGRNGSVKGPPLRYAILRMNSICKLALSALPLACSPSDPTGVDLSGGTGGTGASVAGRSGGGMAGTSAPIAGTGGTNASGSGGSASGGAGTGGSLGGSSGSGGSSAGSAGATLGGSAGNGASAGTTSVGGRGGRAASGGAAGTSSGAGTSGTGTGGAGAGGTSNSAAVPSAGCGKGGKPSDVKTSDHIYTFPSSYDGMKPIPLFIGFHAAGNPIDQIQGLTNGSAIEMNYVRSFGKSAGNEWVYNTDINKVLGWYDEVMANYCIDKSRVFAAGHSSGAQMIVQILTKSDAATHMGFKAVAPVAASNYGAITAPIPVMYIQGKMDNVRNSDGADVVGRFTAVNKCSSTSMPYSGVAMCMSSGTNVNPGCVSYDGCMEPTVWCSHNDPQYSNTNHGWPCFATKAMADFFAALP
jgi:polyhydroxybutyrate depolymerase